MNGILLTSPRTALGSVLAALAADGFRHGARNHGYGGYNDYAFLLRHNRGAFRIGMKHMPQGNTSSLLCLCGISVSLAFYVLYLKFYPRSYHSVILRRVIRRLIQERSQRQNNSISILSSSNRRRQRTIQQATTTASFSVCNESYNDDNNNNDSRTIKISDDDTGLSSIGSIDDSSKQDGVIFRQFHQTSSAVLPSSSSAIPAAASSSSAADQQRMRRRITRRRRTLSESPPDVISRLDDFICLIPEIVDRSRHVDQPISRTRNVLDWLAQIDFDPARTSFFDEDPLDNPEDAAARRALMQGMQSLESIASAGSGSSNCGCVYRSRDNWCQDCLLGSGESVRGGGGRSGRRSDSRAMEVQLEDQGQGPSVLYPRRTSTSSATLDVAFRRSRDDCSTDHSSFVVAVPALGGGAEECYGPEVTTVRASDEGHAAPKKKVFYFEEEEDDDFDSTSEKGDLPHQVHFAASSSGQKYLPDSQLKQVHPLGPTESPLTDGPPHSGGGAAGYDWLRMRIFGVDRKRRISTGSGLSAKFLASRGLLRNHHSFTSAISGTSSEYTYRESLVSKGFSIDCGEDLTDFVIQGEDLLEAAEFSRYTLTNIDQLHEELEFIQRNITYINNKVELLQTRDDLPSFAARYGYGIEESIGNDMETAGAFEPGIRPRQRSRSLCLMPGDSTTATTTTTTSVDNTQVPTFKDIEEDLQPGLTTDGFVWDYGSDLALNPTFTHHRSLNGLAAGETGEDDVSNQLRTRRSRSDEMEYFSLRRGHLSSDDLCVVKSDDDDDDDDDVIDDDPDMTYAAQLPVRQHTESTCDEYFDDDYDMLTHLHR